MTKLFIIDDHQMIIEGIHSLLENEKNIEWMGHAKISSDLFRFLENHTPDIILMDINLPGTGGLELCKEVKTKYPSVHIIALSSIHEPSIVRKMMENGASGYLLKDVSRNEILTAVKEVMKGNTYTSFSVAQALKSKTTHILPVLTRREKEVLELISEGFTNQEISAKLFLNVTTIDSHRKNMLTKFNVKNTAALVKIAVKNGLI